MADNRLYRALTNSCTEALAICKKTEMSAVTELYLQYVKHIYATGLGIEKELNEALAKGETNIIYTNSKNIAVLSNAKMKAGSDAVVAYYFSGKKLGIFSEVYGSHKNTTDNKDNYEACALELKREIKAFDEAKVDFDKLIPR